MVRARRRDLRARPAALGRAARPASTGARSSWSRCRWRWSPCTWRSGSFRPTSTRPPIRSTTSAASCRSCWSAALVLAINFAPVPNEGALALGLGAIALAAARRLRAPPAPGRVTRSTTSRSPDGASSGSRRAPGSSCSARSWARCSSVSSSCRTCSATRRWTPGWRSCRRRAMVVVAPRSAKLVEARGARFTLLVGYAFCLLGFLDDAPAVEGGHLVLEGRARLRPDRHGVGFAGTPASHSLTGPCPCAGPAWPREPPTCSATSAGRSCSRSSVRCSPRATRRRVSTAIAASPDKRQGHRQRPGRADQVVLERRRDRRSATRSTRARSWPPRRRPSSRGRLGLRRRDRRDPARRRARLLPVPRRRTRGGAARAVPRRGPPQGAAEPGGCRAVAAIGASYDRSRFGLAPQSGRPAGLGSWIAAGFAIGSACFLSARSRASSSSWARAPTASCSSPARCSSRSPRAGAAGVDAAAGAVGFGRLLVERGRPVRRAPCCSTSAPTTPCEDGLSTQQQNRLVWAPDLLGSGCFLVSGALAYRVATARGCARSAGTAPGGWRR